jgi:hypothetical protein
MNKAGTILAVLIFAGLSTSVVAQAATAQSDKEKRERVAIERYFHEALDGRNYNYIAELFAPDGVQYFPGLPPIRGNTTMVTAMNALLGPSKSFKTTVKAILVQGNQVMASIEHVMVYGPSGKFKTQPGVQPEFLDLGGKTITWKAMALFIFDDNGRVLEEYINRDDVGIYLQGGAVKVTQ